jgi:hypothetical protein
MTQDVYGRPTSASQAAELGYWERNRLEHWNQDWRRYLEFFPFHEINWTTHHVLDVGSGPVSILEYVAPPGARVSAFDALAEDYNRLFPDKRVAIVDSLPVGPFDRILMLNMLDHMADPEELLLEIRKRLSADGEIWLHVHVERPYPSDEHPQHFQFWQLNLLLSRYFQLRRVRLFRDGPVWPYAWCAVCGPRRGGALERAFAIAWADVVCAVARVWFLIFRTAVRATKKLGLRRILPAHLRF